MKPINHRFIGGLELKRCAKCKFWISIEMYGLHRQRRDGLQDYCKNCRVNYCKNRDKRSHNANNRRLYWKNIEKSREKNKKAQKEWAEKRPERVKEIRRESAKRCRLKNPEETREKTNKWRHSNIERVRKNQKYSSKKRLLNPKNRLAHNLRCAIKRHLKLGKNGRNTFDILDFTPSQLKKHLTKTMPEGYTWDDYLAGKLHVDHIIPISAFNFDKPEDHDFKKCWSLDNLQLLPALENISKGNKLDAPFQPSLMFKWINEIH